MRKKQIQYISLIALLAIMLILLLQVFLPYMSVILWSAICYILINPLYKILISKLKRTSPLFEAKRRLLAGAFSVGTILLMSGVFFFVAFQLIGQGRFFLDEVKQFIAANPNFFNDSNIGKSIARIVNEVSLGTVNLSGMNIKIELLDFIGSYSATIGSFARGIVANIGNLLISLVFMCFALYFFYLDGPYLASLLIDAIPIDKRNSTQLLAKFRDVTTNLFMGFFLVALYQAVAAFTIFSIFRINGSLLFSVLILFSSFVPMLGCALIWIPLGFATLATRGLPTGIAFMVLCAIFISFIDNFLRPFFLKDRIKIHPLLIFFSILGGLKAFGFNGIILGPMIVILFFTIVDIALENEIATPANPPVAGPDE